MPLCVGQNASRNQADLILQATNSYSNTPLFAVLKVMVVIISIIAMIAAVVIPIVINLQTSENTTTVTTAATSTTPGTNCTVVPSDRTLQAYYSFDNGSTTDMSLFSHPTTYLNQVTVSGHSNQALYFTGNTTLNSYFQISNLTSLGTSNTPYSISLWLNPAALYGDVVFVTVNSNGLGGYCFPFLGFVASTQRLAAQVWDGSSARSALGPVLPLNTWTHVAETWSSANGLNLYVNGNLYATTAVSTYIASGTPSYLTIASTMGSYATSGWCTSTGVLVWNYYNGAVDELRIYSRELNNTEVYNLAKC